MMSYFGAKALTNIHVDASTWQIDFTARLTGIDEQARLANEDQYGHATFLLSGFNVQKKDGNYIAEAGTGYVSGLRCDLESETRIIDVVVNSYIYIDASYQGGLTSQWGTVVCIINSEIELNDNVDDSGVCHYLTKIADIDAQGEVTDTRFVGGTAAFERVDNAATDEDIDSESLDEKHVKLPQFYRGIKQYVLNKLWLALALKICPVGVPMPWGTDIAPEGFAIHKGQAFDVVAYPELAKVYPDGLIPDMRGLGIIGKDDGEIILAYEEGQVKEHDHDGSIVNSTELGNKTTNSIGEHYHSFEISNNYGSLNSGNNKLTAVDMGQAKSSPVSTIGGITFNTGSSGNHNHSVPIGSHTHSLAIALFGAVKNTINHRKFNWIVRLA